MRRLAWASAVAILVAYAALQYWWLPADGFFSGDSGTKYLQARAVLQHGPFHPWVEGPSLSIDPGLRWHEPFLLPIHGHLVGVFPWLFAALTAPFLGLFGLRGLYVVPAAGVAGVWLATRAVARAAGQSEPWAMASGWCAVVATPLLFYGAELWEHAPAAALSTGAVALLLGAGGWRPRAVAGVLLAAAASMRPETIAVIPAVFLVRSRIGRVRETAREFLPVLIGLGGAGVLVGVANVVIYGAVIPQHVSSNLEAGFSYWAMRREIVETLVLPSRGVIVFLLGLATLIASAVVRRAQAGAAALGVVLMLGSTIGLPLWRMYAGGVPWLSSFDTASLAQTFPLLAVLAIAAAGASREIRGMAMALLVLIFLAMPHTGGAQWSARFFLPAAPFVAIAAIDVLRAARFRAVAALILAVSIGVQLYGIAFLRQFKRINAYVVHAAARTIGPDEVLVTDLFWVPEICATLYPTRRVLFIASPAELAGVASAAATEGRTLWFATSPALTGYQPPLSIGQGSSGDLYRLRRRVDPSAASLVFFEYVR